MTSAQNVMLLLDLGIVLVLARLLGALAERLDQPPVIGEIIAGVLAGPTLAHGVIARILFPVDIRPMLSALANLGVVLFMFLVGMEFNRGLIRGRAGTVLTVSLGSVLVPFTLGALLAVFLLPHHPARHEPTFVLFLGTAMSVTAFPVLARILRDRGMTGTPIGGLVLASAAVGDLLAWSMLAVVVAVLGGNGEAWWHILLVAPFLVALVPLRSLLAWLSRRVSAQMMFAAALAGLLACSSATEWAGLHFLFGAFLFGLVMPRSSAPDLRRVMTERIEQIVRLLLLPVYFVVAGLNVDLSHLGTASIGEFGLIMVVAVGGKFVGAYTGARLHHIEPRRAAAVGTLMNSRGLTELIILTTGQQLGLLDRDLYSLMVLMAVVTTVMTGPLLRLWYPRALRDQDLESVDKPTLAPDQRLLGR